MKKINISSNIPQKKMIGLRKNKYEKVVHGGGGVG